MVQMALGQGYSDLVTDSVQMLSRLGEVCENGCSHPTQTFKNALFNPGIDILPKQVEELKLRSGAIFNLLCVGQSGLGKTTFINTLFGTSVLSNVWQEVEYKQPNVSFAKTTRVVSHKARLREDGFNLDFTVVDTPGFGDYIDNQFAYLAVTDYIDEQLRLYMFQEEQPYRDEKVDNRVHLCLFFINTSSRGISPGDIEAMKHISSRVNLIPVIPKADTLTTSEIAEMKRLVQQIITTQGIKICDFIDDESLKQSVTSQVPFTLIGSESYVYSTEAESSVLGRKYRWGIAEVESPEHCDFIKLRDLLMASNMVDLILSTELYYESCRSKLIRTRVKQAKEMFASDNSLANINFVNPDLNSLDICKILCKFGKKQVDELVVQWSPIFVQKQLIMKKRYTEIITHEEKKFKDWKRALFAKQSAFNQEIDELQKQVAELSKDIHRLKGKEEVKAEATVEEDTVVEKQATNVND